MPCRGDYQALPKCDPSRHECRSALNSGLIPKGIRIAGRKQCGVPAEQLLDCQRGQFIVDGFQSFIALCLLGPVHHVDIDG